MVFFFQGNHWIHRLLFWHRCFVWLGWQLLKLWRRFRWVFQESIFLHDPIFVLIDWLICLNLIKMILEFSFESSEDGVLSFFNCISLFVGLSDVIISEFINEKLCWVSIVWEKFVISIELISHSSFLKWDKKLHHRVWWVQQGFHIRMGSWRRFWVQGWDIVQPLNLRTSIVYRFWSSFCMIAPLNYWYKSILLRKEWWSYLEVMYAVWLDLIILGMLRIFGYQLFFHPEIVQKRLLSLILNPIFIYRFLIFNQSNN